MRPGIYGKKIGMTQIFDDAGLAVPVTVIDTSDCLVTQVKTAQTDGYNAIQVGFGARKPQNVTKAKTGHFKKANVAAKASTSEIRFDKDTDLTQIKMGAPLSVNMFTKGDRVDVVGTSRGKGFTGVIKRYGWHGADATHGASKYFRHGGSNGTNTFPGRVLKNHGNPGQTGNAKVTTLNVLVVDVKPEQNLLLLRGAVPGSKNGFVMVRSTNRRPTPKDRALITA
jgi:large subunit ribosomal protein L3